MATKFYNPEINFMANGHAKTVTNGHTTVNGYANGSCDPRPLDIAIIGAGIGGLSAAIGFRRNGHNVSVSLPT